MCCEGKDLNTMPQSELESAGVMHLMSLQAAGENLRDADHHLSRAAAVSSALYTNTGYKLDELINISDYFWGNNPANKGRRYDKR